MNKKKFYIKKDETTKKVSIVEVIKIEVSKNDNHKFIPNRIVEEYWTTNGIHIGTIDPLSPYSSIVEAVKHGYVHTLPINKKN